MKILILMRHAEAIEGYFGVDFDRPLTKHGIDQAKIASIILKENIKTIDKILCSPAVRTRETYHIVSEIMHEAQVSYHQEMYNASYNDLVQLIEQQDQSLIMLISHNPGISELANILLNQDDVLSLSQSSFVILKFPLLKSWSKLSTTEINLEFMYNAKL